MYTFQRITGKFKWNETSRKSYAYEFYGRQIGNTTPRARSRVRVCV